jgi:hypothetical protein
MVPNRKRRCYQRRSGAPTRGTGPLRLALAGATRSGSAGVGSLARDPLARLRRVQVESIGTTINFRPASSITHRDIAVSALLIASKLALTAAEKKSRRLVDPQGYEGTGEAHH